jgi:putative cell wall-binding protein
MEPLKKLQSLCDTTNRRYHSGQNDDDQVRALFNYANKNTSVCVVIGYDSYNAITAEEIIKFYKENPGTEIKKENDFSYVKMNYSNVKILSKLLS